jgi:dTDP-4-dehydrorhamnose reductase
LRLAALSVSIMRSVVIGGSGQIGGWLLRAIRERGDEALGTYATVPFPGLVHLDAADREASANWLRESRPDVVYYPAGFTWVDGCERDPARARSANLEQPLNLARIAHQIGARFVSFSTDYVFDGVNGPYTEGSPVNPLSVYGQAKLDAERALDAELGDSVLSIRTSWVFGPERQGKNFAYQLVRTLSDHKSLPCPIDQVSSPSYGPDVARAAIALVNQGRSGLIHVVGPEVMNRFEFARSIATGFGLDPDLIIAKTTAELGQTTPRPLNGGLLTPKLDQWLPGAMRSLAECLDDFRACATDKDWSPIVR